MLGALKDVKNTIRSLPAGTLMDTPEITLDELQLAVRNHSMPLEALHYPITPLGMHYLLTHFDIPAVEPATWELTVGGQVKKTLRLNLDELKARQLSIGRTWPHEIAVRNAWEFETAPKTPPCIFIICRAAR